MKRILVTGGAGLLGSELAARLVDNGYTVRVMSRSPQRSVNPAVEWAQADLGTGAGLAEAVRGVDMIYHAASNSRRDTYNVDVRGTGRLLDAARQANVGHVLYMSIVGIERVPFAYYEHKLAAERVVEQGGVPWSILRATQFHEFLDLLLTMFVRLPVALLPLDWQSQPISMRETAAHLAMYADAPTSGRLPDIGGPEVLRMGEITRAWLNARGMRRPLLHLPIPGAMSAGFRGGGILVPERRIGTMTWAEWLATRYGAHIEETQRSVGYRQPAKG